MSDVPARFGARQWTTAIVVAIVAFAAASLLDGWAYRALYDPRVYDRDWGRLLRMAGFLPTWAIVSIALLRTDPGFLPGAPPEARARRWRGALPLAATIVAGITGELLKLVFRRERPWAHGGAYVFRSFSDRPFYNGGLALPSSHAVVAFAAAAMLARLYPRTRWLWYGLAAACAVTRVMARAHFVSDVTAGALVSWAVVAWLWRWYLRREARAVASCRPLPHTPAGSA